MGGKKLIKYVGVYPVGETSIRIRLKEHSKSYNIPVTDKNLLWASNMRAKWVIEIASGLIPSELEESVVSKSVSVTDVLNNWMKSVERRVTPSTLATYRYTHKVFCDYFGDKEIATLTLGDIKSYCHQCTTEPVTINKYLSVLRAAITEAVEDELVDRNILRDWRFTANRVKPKKEADPFDQGEQALIFGETKGQIKNLFQFAMWTGMRTSEIIALRWANVDFTKRIIYVRESKTKNDKMSKQKGKTGMAMRDIKMLGPAYDALMAQREFTQLQGAEVFNDPDTNKPFVGDYAIRVNHWTPLLKKLNIRYRKPYQTRHTYASMMLTSGEDHAWICNQLGHTDLTMLSKNYGRWIETAVNNSGSKAEQLFGKTQGNVGQI